MNLEAPRTLPVQHLSHSSINTYEMCPERWRRRYLELEYSPPNQKMIAGKVVGRAVAAGYIDKIQSGVVNAELLTDTFDTEWAEAEQEEVDWEEFTPGQVKDQAAQSLVAYAPMMADVQPVTVEESFEVSLPDTDFVTLGYMDFLDSSSIFDLKVSGNAKSQSDLDNDGQATLYTLAKWLQGDGLRPFKWHAICRPSPGGRRGAFAAELTTTRTSVQANNYLEKIALVAREIDWRHQTGNWSGAAPGSWMCSAKGCSFWNTCPYGGQK